MKIRLSALFVMILIGLLWAHGSRLVYTGDEGILLEPAQRVAEGYRPYADFWAYMSPGSYWLQSLVFRVFGVSMITGRLLTLADFSLQCTLLFWLVCRLGSQKAAWITLVCFVGFQIADPTLLTAQHRWDSSTWGLASVCMAIRASNRAQWAASGAMAAVAILCTPSVGLLCGATLVWLVTGRDRRRWMIPYCAGGCAVAVVTLAVMAGQGTLIPFVEQLRWLRSNYSEVNIMFYGSIIGGYGKLVEGVSGVQLVMVALLAAMVALPALLPVVGGIAWLRELLRGRASSEVVLLLLAMVALIAAAFPRADVFHLAFVAAIPYALTGSWIARLASAVGTPVAVFGLVIALSFGSHSAVQWFRLQPVSSPVGTLKVPAPEEPAVRSLLDRVPREGSLYVHPYMPVFYYLTQARNPTRYAFLCPGMTPVADEQRVLDDLKRKPPEWVMYLPLAREDFLRVFPHGEKLNHRFERVEGWIEANYRPVEPQVALSGYRLWRKRENM